MNAIDARDPADLLALAARVEAEGRYNVAKLLRAAASALVQRRADDRLANAPRGGALFDALERVAAAFAADAQLAPLAPPLRAATATFAAGSVPLLTEAPDPAVCRRCGWIEPPGGAPRLEGAACPRCAADDATFHVVRPVWWLERYDPPAALRQLERTPRRVAALLRGIAEHAWRVAPEAGAWSPHQVVAHLRDAQQVLEARVERILEHDDPDLAAQQVWTWAAAGSTDTTATVLAAYTSSRERVLTRLRAAPAGAWWRSGRHEEFGRLTLTEQVSYFAAHETTHLRQLRRAATGAAA